MKKRGEVLLWGEGPQSQKSGGRRGDQEPTREAPCQTGERVEISRIISIKQEMGEPSQAEYQEN